MTFVFFSIMIFLDHEYSKDKMLTPIKRARASSSIKGKVSGGFSW